MLPVLADGTPLCELPEFADRPHAYVKLWKHHAAQPQADRINALAHARGEPWIARYGGLISSEWEFAKGLQLLEEDREIYDRMDHWIEAADWIIWQLSGRYVRNACTAGYKGIYQDGRYPTADFLAALNPDFADFARGQGRPRDRPARRRGRRLTAAGGAVDRAARGHRGRRRQRRRARDRARRAGHRAGPDGRDHGHLDLPRDERRPTRRGPRHVRRRRRRDRPGTAGYEAGQSGVGDIFAWYVANQVPGSYVAAAAAVGQSVHEYLTELADQEPVGAHGLVALDWHSGNRSVLVDHELSGVVLGQTLATTPEQVYRALLEATAFGTRVIVETFDAAGVPVTEFIVAGGLLKNRLLMQIYADVLRRPISTIGSEQGPALGSAIHAAVAAGAYPDVRAAAAAMGAVERAVYVPDERAADGYDQLFAEYRRLHDYFGRGGNEVMQRLRAIRREAAA